MPLHPNLGVCGSLGEKKEEPGHPGYFCPLWFCAQLRGVLDQREERPLINVQEEFC